EPRHGSARIRNMPCSCGKSEWYTEDVRKSSICTQCQYQYQLSHGYKHEKLLEEHEIASPGILACAMFLCENQKCHKCSMCMKNQVWKRKEQRKQNILDS